jgi:transmembrane sensor
VVDLAQVDAWRRGLLIFSDEPLSQVVDEINRYRPGRIVLANRRLGGIPVNAVFQLDRMDRALSQIREVADARVTTLPGGVVMLS